MRSETDGTAGAPRPRQGAFLAGSRARHRAHGAVDVLAVVGPQRVIRVQSGANASRIAVLAVHVDELEPVLVAVPR